MQAWRSSEYSDDFDSDSESTSNDKKKKKEEEETRVSTYEFIINRWFATDEDDGAIIRELVPSNDEKVGLGRGTSVYQVESN